MSGNGSGAAFCVNAIEVHAEGEPGRVLLDAGSLLTGDTMPERLAFARAELHWLREAMLHEPRGYPGLCAVILTPPVEAGSDFGIVVLEQGGFTPMSGSNTMCAVAGAVEAGLIAAVEPVTEVRIDTAVGTITARAEVSDGRVTSVTVANVPAFVVDLDVPLEVPSFGRIHADIVFGGQFFAQAPVEQFGLPLDPALGRDLVRAGALLKLAANEQAPVTHPDRPEVSGISLVMLHSGDRAPGQEGRNTVVLTQGELRRDDPATWSGALDRSPCGTGTSARMAALHARGQLAIGEDFVHRSIIGSRFIGRLVGETTVAGRPAVLPTISGRTWVTGRSQWRIEPSELFPRGYTVGDIWAPGL